MRMFVFEGTIEEIKELQRELMRSGVSTMAVETRGEGPEEGANEGLTAGRRFISEEVAFRFLTRRSLSTEQRAVIAAIYNSRPDGVLATELQRRINYSPSKFAGLMGAFGRRLVNTQGYVDPSWLFDNQWEAEQGCNRYRLPDSVRKAVEKAGLV
jgi:predicted transcriptional regulator with HTH domain